jgi:ATP-dependent Clp protease ATP-binding subunit ClpB
MFKMMSLRPQVEEAALSKEKDKASQERLDDVRKEVAALQDELRPLLSRYNKERDRLQELRRLRKKREDLQVGSQPTLGRQLRCAQRIC